MQYKNTSGRRSDEERAQATDLEELELLRVLGFPEADVKDEQKRREAARRG